MNCLFLLFAVLWTLVAVPVSAHESSNPERDQSRRLRIELEPAPISAQRDFDRYVQELAAAAQSEARLPAARKDGEKEQQAKALNPMVLFRW
jgi:hypothetical protein